MSNLVMEILDRHVELAGWAESEEAVHVWDSYLRAQDKSKLDFVRGDQGVTMPEAYAESAAHMLGLAETYYVTPDMVDLIEEAMLTINREPLRAHMVPSRIGWIEFGRPVELGVDHHDKPIMIAGVSWRVEDPEANVPGLAPGIKWYDADNVPHVTPGISEIWWNLTEAHIDENPAMSDLLSWAFPGQFTGWAFDTPWEPEDRNDDFRLDSSGEFQRKLLLTTFNLLMDELVMVRKHRPNRGALRRAARKLHHPDYGDVHIVELRHARTLDLDPREPDDEDAEPVMWTHRWISRAHWRTIHRGTEKERQVYVRQSIKGPKNRPLIVKDRLNLLRR